MKMSARKRIVSIGFEKILWSCVPKKKDLLKCFTKVRLSCFYPFKALVVCVIYICSREKMSSEWNWNKFIILSIQLFAGFVLKTFEYMLFSENFKRSCDYLSITDNFIIFVRYNLNYQYNVSACYCVLSKFHFSAWFCILKILLFKFLNEVVNVWFLKFLWTINVQILIYSSWQVKPVTYFHKENLYRRGSWGVESLTCDPVLALGQRLNFPLPAVIMDDNAPTHKRRKLVKTYKNVLPRKHIMVAEVCGETYSKIWQKDGVEKRPQM